MRRSGSYSSYRGRMTFQNFLRGLIVVLAVILVLALVGYFVLQRYIVYTDNGARLDLPFLNGEKEPDPSDSVHIVVEEKESPSPSPAESQPAETRAVWLPLTALADGTAEEQVSAAGGNAVVFDMKLGDGSLAYHSGQELADQVQANMADEDGSREAAIRALNESGLYTVARISCFQDDKLYRADRALNILTNSGYLWKDPAGVRWTSPANEEVRAYLAGIAAELAQLGFDEILLDCAGYPVEGELSWIRRGEAYTPGQLDQVIGGFYEEMAQALKPFETKLSIRTTEEALTGADTLSGQTAANLAAWADRVWVEPARQDGTDYGALLTAAGAEDPEALLVPLLDGPGEERACWAVLPEM